MAESGWGSDSVNKTITEKIIYNSDGLKVSGYISYPANSLNLLPCVIWCRGGYASRGAIDEFNAAGIFGQIAAEGYVVLAPQYRGSPGSEGTDEVGGNDLNDIFNIMPVADEIPCADTSTWGIEGWSRGGLMALLAIIRTDVFKSVVLTGAITSLSPDRFNPGFLQKLLSDNPSIIPINEKDFIKQRSVLSLADKIPSTSNLLIIHGTADEQVPASHSLDLASNLIKSGKNFRLLLLDKGDHFLKKHRKEVDRERFAWMKKHLRIKGSN